MELEDTDPSFNGSVLVPTWSPLSGIPFPPPGITNPREGCLGASLRDIKNGRHKEAMGA